MFQKKVAQILFSTRTMSLLFISFAVAMAVGTFVENSYSTATARAWIYNAWWFEAIMIVFALNFLGNIKRYRLLRREKLNTLIFHLSFLLILVGAGVTRYIGYEGIMPIREGETTNIMLSEKTYLSIMMDGEVDGEPLRRAQDLSLNLAPKINNHKTLSTDFKGQEVDFEVVEFIPAAEEGLVETEDGNTYLKIVEASGGDRHDHYLEENEVTSIHNILFAFNKPTEGAININISDEGSTISSPFEGDYMRMSDQKKGIVVADSLQPLMMRSLYNMAEMQFVLPDAPVKGKYDLIASETKEEGQPDGVVLNITSNGETQQVKMLGAKGYVNDYKQVNVGGLEIYARYGSKEYELPFSLKLNDFIADKYPGTENNPMPSYSAFKSKVDLIDGGEVTKHEVFMNNVLDYKGYRFFQASFDADEKGTVLSVNHDWWGTWITYIGYFLLYLGMMILLFERGSRFGELERKLTKIKAKKASLGVIAALLFCVSGFAQDNQDNGDAAHEHSTSMISPKSQVDSVVMATAVSKEHAAKFGRLIIQDAGGRMKPANTYSSELIRKLSKSDHYEGLNSDQVLVSMTENPAMWYNVPLIYVKAKNDSLHHVIGVEEGAKHIPLAQFFDERGAYKLSPFLEEAYRAKVKNQFQKDFISADEKVNLLYNALEGKILKIFPIPEAENNKWVSYPEARELEGKFKGVDSLYTLNVLPLYMQTLRKARTTEDYSKSNEVLSSIEGFQKKYGEEVMPSQEKIDTEILYNKYDVFKNLFWQYMVVGLLMFVVVIIQIFRNTKNIRRSIKFFQILIFILFLVHTTGLIARWYISGHAPWSDAYESMIYVAWATMFFGLAFGRKSDLTTASTAFVTSMILMIAHWNWMDPAIANLQPVLDSYWLMIHVAVIVASYGPFTLGMILGLVSLLLMILTNEKNKKKMAINIQELTIITELCLTVGLVLLTIGNFLGGQWANESWGRYWGWDPKETWALISIMVYAFVIHMRLVPGLRGRFAFNWAAILAFASILMTYFGVNFYLTGLHSYASGDQIISYQFIFIAFGAWALLGAVAYRKYKRFYKK
ncbi:cytochrome c biogenesis protein CcsA [Mesonia sp. MT50]|uniref:Cytochrome c biogenesis protein CcsA n=1 Tax=Mesonia profundi TaxID=3070998 RepID=A0ABU1A3R2_9FLAO|nr:cytochrome c biogenesis protein CcsA [Mesonia profundi]MDQ7917901.1 cytochrome c biogenesis protein CcsA [Mesonia profundi]